MGWRTLNGVQEFHRGMDIPAPLGTKIYAAADGVVSTKAHYTYGTCVKLSHGGGLVTIYAHMSAWAEGIADGVPVKQGQLIGYVGRTGRAYGYHLHFEANLNGRARGRSRLSGVARSFGSAGHARPAGGSACKSSFGFLGRRSIWHDSRRRCAASCAAPRARQCPGRSLFFSTKKEPSDALGRLPYAWAQLHAGLPAIIPLFRKAHRKSKNGFEPYKGSDGRNCVSASCEPCLVQLPLTIPGHCKMY